MFVFRSYSSMEDVTEGGGDGAAETAASTNAAENVPPRGIGGWGTTDTTNNTANTEEGEGWESNGWGADTDWDSEVVTIHPDEDAVTGTRVVEVSNEPDGDTNTTTDANTDANANTSNGADDDESWNVFRPASLIPLLGPTALPITHTTGIVESSVRRIKAVFPPSPDTSKFPVAKDVSAEAVEGVLRRTFGVVVFEPWVNWNRGEEPHLSMPKILESSRGAVKIKSGETGTGDADAGTVGAKAAEPGALPPFDPHKDEISVLVDPAYLDLISVGMGCLGTWVQMVRVEDLEPQDPKKKKKKNAKMERFWYVEELLRVVPSYYTYLG